MSSLTIDTWSSKTLTGIEKDGVKVPERFTLESIEVEREVNKIPTLILTFVDDKPQVSTETIEKESSGYFDIGRTIRLEVRKDVAKLYFTGLVVKNAIDYDGSGQRFTVTVKHPAYRLTGNVKSAVYKGLKKGEEGLKEGEEAVDWSFYQNFCSDWDFLVSMADLHCKWVVMEGNDFKLAGLEEAKIDTNLVDSYKDETHWVFDNKLHGKYQCTSNISKDSGPFALAIASPGGGAGADAPIEKKALDLSKIKDNDLLSIDCENNLEGVYNSVNASYPLGSLAEKGSVNTPELKGLGRERLDYFIPTTPYSDKKEGGSRRGELVDEAKKIVVAKAWRSLCSLNRGYLRYNNNSISDFGGAKPPPPPPPKKESDDKKKGPNSSEPSFDGVGPGSSQGKDKNEDKPADEPYIYLGQKIDGFSDFGIALPDSLIHFARVTRIKHQINQEGWFLDIGWGMDPKFHIEAHPDINRPPAFGLIPGVKGIQVGIVTTNETDNQEMLTVKLFDESVIKIKKMNPIFAGALYSRDNEQAGGDKVEKTGWPQYAEGDIVLIDFINGDPNKGVVLGLFSSVSAELKDSAKSNLVKPLGGDGDGDDSIASEKDVSLSIPK